MKPMTRDHMFGMYQGDRVMVVGVPDEIGDLDGLCEIEYPDPLSNDPPGTRKRVRWGDVHLTEGVQHQG